MISYVRSLWYHFFERSDITLWYHFDITKDWEHTSTTNDEQNEFQHLRTYETLYISLRITMRKQCIIMRLVWTDEVMPQWYQSDVTVISLWYHKKVLQNITCDITLISQRGYKEISHVISLWYHLAGFRGVSQDGPRIR